MAYDLMTVAASISRILAHHNKRYGYVQTSLSLSSGFSHLYKNRQFVDVTLQVDQSEFPCHKSVLAASSPYFMAMFSTNLAEGGLSSITLKDMEASTLELVLDYVYTGQVEVARLAYKNCRPAIHSDFI